MILTNVQNPNASQYNKPLGPVQLDINGNLPPLTIQLLTGTDETLSGETLKLGQVGFPTDKIAQQFRIGDGSTLGGNVFLASVSGIAGSISTNYTSAAGSISFQLVDDTVNGVTLTASGFVSLPSSASEAAMSLTVADTFGVNTVGLVSDGVGFRAASETGTQGALVIGINADASNATYIAGPLQSAIGQLYQTANDPFDNVGAYGPAPAGLPSKTSATTTTSGTNETTLFTVSVPANTFVDPINGEFSGEPATGQSIKFDWSAIFANTSTKRIRWYEGATVVYDSGIMTASGAGEMNGWTEFIAFGTTGLKSATVANATGVTVAAPTGHAVITGLNLATTAYTLKMTCQCGSGAATGDGTLNYVKPTYYP